MRKFSVVTLLFAFFLTFLFSTQAIAQRAKVWGQNQVGIAGAVDTALKSTVAVYSGDKYQCSGALVGTNSVLVPLSCVDKFRQSDLTVAFGRFLSNSTKVAVKQKLSQSGSSARVAILKVGRTPSGFSPTPVHREHRTIHCAHLVQFAGYGETANGAKNSARELRIREVYYYDPTPNDSDEGLMLKKPSGTVPCLGDTGAPAYDRSLKQWHVSLMMDTVNGCVKLLYQAIDLRFHQKWVNAAIASSKQEPEFSIPYQKPSSKRTTIKEWWGTQLPGVPNEPGIPEVVPIIFEAPCRINAEAFR